MVPEPDILEILRYETSDAVEKSSGIDVYSEMAAKKTLRVLGSLSSQGSKEYVTSFRSIERPRRVLGPLMLPQEHT